jgi:hypothetical protein
MIVLLLFWTNWSVMAHCAWVVISVARMFFPRRVSVAFNEGVFVLAAGLCIPVSVAFWTLWNTDPGTLIRPSDRAAFPMTLAHLQHTFPAVFLLLDAVLVPHPLVLGAMTECVLPIATTLLWFVVACTPAFLGYISFPYPFMHSLRLVDWFFLVLVFFIVSVGSSCFFRWIRGIKSKKLNKQ